MNKSTILSIIYNENNVSRAELAKRTKISSKRAIHRRTIRGFK